MTFEILGVKSTTLIPAIGGAIVYALRAAEQSPWARASGFVAGVLTASFVGPPAVVAAESYFQMENLNGGITFSIGVLGAGLVEIAYGLMKDYKGVFRALTRRGKA